MTDYGTVTVEGDHAVLTFERRFPFPIDRVWAAITDDAERKAWFGNGTVDPHGDETVLLFTHRGLSERNAKGFAPGTHAFFDRAQAHLGGETPPNWSERYAEVAPHYPSWRQD